MTRKRSEDRRLQQVLDQCAAEPVHIPGVIQSNGAILGVDVRNERVLYASSNTDKVIGRDVSTILGAKLETFLPRDVRHRMMNGVVSADPGLEINELGRVEISDRSFLVTACFAPNCTIFEFEPLRREAEDAPNSLRDLDFLISRVRQVDTQEQLFQTSTQILQLITGYDRVIVYKFDEEGNGKVVAETAVAGVDKFLGLNFPSWDIPDQARAIMKKIPFRYINDSYPKNVAVLALSPELPDLDMTFAHLRGTSPVHLEYLRNMDTGASFTLNIRVNDTLWGTIAFHHMSPRYPCQSVRQLCRSYGEYFATQISLLQQKDYCAQLKQADAIRRQINKKEHTAKNGILFEKCLLEELCVVMEASGAALLYQQNLISVGDVPKDTNLTRIMMGRPSDLGVVSTSNMGRDQKEIAELAGAEFAGLLLSRLPDDCTFAFFRHSRSTEVTWAGAPVKEIVSDHSGTRLHPRGSFEAYKETVDGTANPWTREQICLAEDLWSMLVTAEREELIEKTNRQQSLLIDELNHRVRNILAIIRTLSQQSREHNSSIDSYIAALEARIAAVASAHDLGAEKKNLRTSVQQILEIETAPYNKGTKRVYILGDDVGIHAELAPIFALVMHELTTNAMKYGALSCTGGTVEIALDHRKDGLCIDWVEKGGPAVVEPREKGFGTTLIETAVPFELNGTSEIDYASEGLKARLTLPQETLVDMVSIEASSSTVANEGLNISSLNPCDAFGKKCLLVEDNYIVSLDTSTVLKDLGFEEVEIARNLIDGLTYLKRFRPGLAILDINLAHGQTSDSIADALVEVNIPFIFVTGYGDTQKLSPKHSGLPVLKKPVQRNELLFALSQLNT